MNYKSVCLYVYLSVCLSDCLSVHLSSHYFQSLLSTFIFVYLPFNNCRQLYSKATIFWRPMIKLLLEVPFLSSLIDDFAENKRLEVKLHPF